MKKSIDVDVYGKCGKLKCSRDNETGCYQNMEQNYKFYLSFENSVCDDYVTEKFFNILDYNVIPVTYSGANFSAIAPPQSYINTLDFASVSKLSKCLSAPPPLLKNRINSWGYGNNPRNQLLDHIYLQFQIW